MSALELAELDRTLASAEAETEAVTDALPVYFKEIGRVPLLTKEQEVALAQAIEAGEAARARLASSEFSPEENEALSEAVSHGDKARERLIESNLRLVVSIARRYVNRGLPLADLVQEGNLGLLRAVQKFDWRRGFKFSTYATWWIRQAVTRAIADHSRTIRIPVHMIEVVNKMVKASGRLQQELGREATQAELAEALDTPEQRIREVLRVLAAPISLEAPLAAGQELSLSDFVTDELAVDLQEAAERAVLRDQMADVLDSLSPRERRVLELRYGLEGDTNQNRTLSQSGDVLGVTRERVRQIESKALRKLRHPSRAKKLRAYAR